MQYIHYFFHMEANLQFPNNIITSTVQPGVTVHSIVVQEQNLEFSMGMVMKNSLQMPLYRNNKQASI